jgi:hypothetical protein
VHNRVVINYRLTWGRNLGADLDAVYDFNAEDGALFNELFDLLEESSDLRDWLSTGRYDRISPRFNVVPIESAISAGYNLYRLKIWDGESQNPVPFRLIFAVSHIHPQELRILGLMPRTDPNVDNYEPDSPFSRRLRDDYEHHRIPRIRRG